MSKLLAGRGATHSLEALISAAEAGTVETPEVTKKELASSAKTAEEHVPLSVDPEETVEPAEDPDNDNAEYGKRRCPYTSRRDGVNP